MPTGVTYVTEKHSFLVKGTLTHLALRIIRGGGDKGGNEGAAASSMTCASTSGAGTLAEIAAISQNSENSASISGRRVGA